MPSATVTSKGQITIPKPIRQVLGVHPGDRVVFWQAADGRVIVEPETVDLRSLRGSLRSESEPVSVEQMNEAIAKGAAEANR